MAFSPENLKICVDSCEIHAFIQTATYPPSTRGTVTGALVGPPRRTEAQPSRALRRRSPHSAYKRMKEKPEGKALIGPKAPA